MNSVNPKFRNSISRSSDKAEALHFDILVYKQIYIKFIYKFIFTFYT